MLSNSRRAQPQAAHLHITGCKTSRTRVWSAKAVRKGPFTPSHSGDGGSGAPQELNLGEGGEGAQMLILDHWSSEVRKGQQIHSLASVWRGEGTSAFIVVRVLNPKGGSGHAGG